MATAKKVAKKKKIVKAPKVSLIPKELTVESRTQVSKVVIKSPLNVQLTIVYDSDGYAENFDVGKVDHNKSTYVCSMLADVLGTAVRYSDAEYEDLLSIVHAARMEHKKNELQRNL